MYNNLLELIQNKSLINRILPHIKLCLKIPNNKTRYQKLISTSSCRGWQLKYMLLYIFNEKYNNIILEKAETIVKINNNNRSHKTNTIQRRTRTRLHNTKIDRVTYKNRTSRNQDDRRKKYKNRYNGNE